MSALICKFQSPSRRAVIGTVRYAITCACTGVSISFTESCHWNLSPHTKTVPLGCFNLLHGELSLELVLVWLREMSDYSFNLLHGELSLELKEDKEDLFLKNVSISFTESCHWNSDDDIHREIMFTFQSPSRRAVIGTCPNPPRFSRVMCQFQSPSRRAVIGTRDEDPHNGTVWFVSISFTESCHWNPCCFTYPQS